ncbi:hypothetical protein I546_5296 [Mycobacterium kansasii 732]|nr:hypothetical protein I546_5296 [Mycobacterium kansasii 732]
MRDRASARRVGVSRLEARPALGPVAPRVALAWQAPEFLARHPAD